MTALSVILVAHNEEQAIGRMLEGLLAHYKHGAGYIQVIFPALRCA